MPHRGRGKNRTSCGHTVPVAVTEQFSNGSILAFYYLQLLEVDEIYSMEQCGFRFRQQKNSNNFGCWVCFLNSFELKYGSKLLYRSKLLYNI